MAYEYFRKVPNFQYINREYDKESLNEFVEVKNLFKRGKLREDIFGNLTYFDKYYVKGNERPDNIAYEFYNNPNLDWVILLSNNILNLQSEWPLSQNIFEEVMIEKYGSYENLYSVRHYVSKEVKNSLGETILPEGIIYRKNDLSTYEISRTRSIKNIKKFSDGIGIITLNSEIKNIIEGEQFIISGISEEYDGRFSVIQSYPNETISILYKLNDYANENLTEINDSGIFSTILPSNYLFYYDIGLKVNKQINPIDYLIPVTNYDYEEEIENKKREIYILKPQYLNVVINDLEKIMEYKKGSGQYVSRTLKKAYNPYRT